MARRQKNIHSALTKDSLLPPDQVITAVGVGVGVGVGVDWGIVRHLKLGQQREVVGRDTGVGATNNF